MKRLSLLTMPLALILSLGVTACGDKENKKPQEQTKPADDNKGDSNTDKNSGDWDKYFEANIDNFALPEFGYKEAAVEHTDIEGISVDNFYSEMYNADPLADTDPTIVAVIHYGKAKDVDGKKITLPACGGDGIFENNKAAESKKAAIIKAFGEKVSSNTLSLGENDDCIDFTVDVRDSASDFYSYGAAAGKITLDFTVEGKVTASLNGVHLVGNHAINYVEDVEDVIFAELLKVVKVADKSITMDLEKFGDELPTSWNDIFAGDIAEAGIDIENAAYIYDDGGNPGFSLFMKTNVDEDDEPTDYPALGLANANLVPGAGTYSICGAGSAYFEDEELLGAVSSILSTRLPNHNLGLAPADSNCIMLYGGLFNSDDEDDVQELYAAAGTLTIEMQVGSDDIKVTIKDLHMMGPTSNGKYTITKFKDFNGTAALYNFGSDE